MQKRTLRRVCLFARCASAVQLYESVTSLAMLPVQQVTNLLPSARLGRCWDALASASWTCDWGGVSGRRGSLNGWARHPGARSGKMPQCAGIGHLSVSQPPKRAAGAVHMRKNFMRQKILHIWWCAAAHEVFIRSGALFCIACIRAALCVESQQVIFSGAMPALPPKNQRSG